MHIVLGNGVLGWEIYQALVRAGIECHLMSRSEFNWPDPKALARLFSYQPEYVWNCIAAGSVSQAKNDYSTMSQLHVGLPVDLMYQLSQNTKLVLFSSDYAANESNPGDPTLYAQPPRSLYALSKIYLEQCFWQVRRPNTVCVRVGSLYSQASFGNSFPGKLMKNYPNPCTVMLPDNRVSPTPAEWLGEFLVKHRGRLFDWAPIVHCVAPRWGVSIREWGQKVLGPAYTTVSMGLDAERPFNSGLGCTVADTPDWEELWNKYGLTR